MSAPRVDPAKQRKPLFHVLAVFSGIGWYLVSAYVLAFIYGVILTIPLLRAATMRDTFFGQVDAAIMVNVIPAITSFMVAQWVEKQPGPSKIYIGTFIYGLIVLILSSFSLVGLFVTEGISFMVLNAAFHVCVSLFYMGKCVGVPFCGSFEEGT